ncbi:hypothetical protein FE783_11010 [Paenibacillus mesophilus]|uniref:hypothetical protein n=1 Tax=Paenibacillus mesophilus TaxID=2582849 RepID=UPI00110E178D|nr:hypothetical protein [Paenibacillus mesophilus]TMV50086.1 hypothetical protein FE783_11010 [Paenibacillus mesophilus]
MKELGKRSLQTDPKRDAIRRSGRDGEMGRPTALTNLLQLHRTVGNRAVGRLLQHTLQRTSDDKAQSSAASSAEPGYFLIPECKSIETARDIFSRISLGDSGALQFVSQQAYTSFKDNQQLMEWGLAGKGEQFILIPGNNGSVNWEGIDDKYDPIAHSHPKQDPKETKYGIQESQWVSQFKEGRPISKDMTLEQWHHSYPTQSDILYPGSIQAESHRVFTPWQVKQDGETDGYTAFHNQEVKPEDQLVFEIVKPRNTGYSRIKSINGREQRPSPLYICDMRILQGSKELFVLQNVKANVLEEKYQPVIGETFPNPEKEVPAVVEQEQQKDDVQEEGDPFADFSSFHS